MLDTEAELLAGRSRTAPVDLVRFRCSLRKLQLSKIGFNFKESGLIRKRREREGPSSLFQKKNGKGKNAFELFPLDKLLKKNFLIFAKYTHFALPESGAEICHFLFFFFFFFSRNARAPPSPESRSEITLSPTPINAN